MCKVSVIIPVKNAEQNISRAIQSIQAQSFSDWEMIAIDDGSTDGSTDLVQQLANSDPRIRPAENPQSGIAHALNHGISTAQGTLIARMDADDFSHPERLAEQVLFLKTHEAVGLVATQINFLGDRNKHEGYASYVDWTNQLLKWDDIRANRFVESPFAHPSVMFRKSLISSGSGPYRQGGFPEDYELWLRWIEKNIQMAKLESVLLDWYDPPDRLSRTDPRYSTDSFYKIKAHYLANWLKHEKHSKRPVWIWGSGRITRKRTRYLREKGIPFSGYLDIAPRKSGTKINNLPVLPPDQLDLAQNPFVISYVGNRGAREDIRSFLIKSDLVEERDFILAA